MAKKLNDVVKDNSAYKLAPGATLSAPDAKKRLLALIEEGVTVEDACRAVGKSVKSYEYYRSSDPQFREAIDLARVIKRRDGVISDEDKNILYNFLDVISKSGFGLFMWLYYGRVFA